MFLQQKQKLAIGLIAGLLVNSTAQAVDPAGLQRAIASGEHITVLDIRSAALFQKDHIAGAINVPAGLVRDKKLPPLGKVVVCDDGLGRDEVALAAVAELNQKKGITAELLDGGYAGWKASLGMTTETRGLHAEQMNFITYDQLKKSNPDQLVLVDLRKPQAQVRQNDAGIASAPPLTDLAKEFPQAPVTKSAFKLPQARQSASGQTSVEPVRVLIDNGDGTAEVMARTLKANGITKVVILAGGEAILARHGQAGLQRIGGNKNAVKPIINSSGSH